MSEFLFPRGVPGIKGLYTTLVPLWACALFGPIRILVPGPDSALAADESVSTYLLTHPVKWFDWDL